MENFKDRLEFLFGADAGPSKIAKSIGMAYAGFARVWYEGSIPKVETMINIQNATGCDLNWLLTGRGEPFREQERNKDKTTDALKEPLMIYDVLGRPVNIDEFVFIPLYMIEASAGYGNAVDSEDNKLVVAFRKYWIHNYLNADPKDLSVIKIRGDSMQGVLNNGDSVLINHKKTTPKDGLFILRIDGSLFAKRLQVLPDNKLLIKSANKEYEPFTIDAKHPPDDFKIIGEIEWIARQV